MLHLGSFIKFLSKNKLYTAINIFGFAISLMFVVIIADYTIRQLTTDQFHEKANRIYVLGTESFMGASYKLSDDLVAEYPEIETICGYATLEPSIDQDGIKSQVLTAFVDSNFFDVFSFKLIEGDRHSALVSRNSVVVTESYAYKAWGTTQGVIGKDVIFAAEGEGSKAVSRIVTAVVEDMKNTLFPAEIGLFVNLGNVSAYNTSVNKQDYGNAAGNIPFVLVKENTDLPSKLDDMLDFFQDFYWIYRDGAMKQVTLTPLTDVPFSTLDSFERINKSSWSFVIILLSVGILILFFAVINYINLTVAQTSMRAKEMATRRLLGATKTEIVYRYISESVLLCTLAFLIAFGLAAIAEPYAVSLLQSPLSVVHDLSWARVIAYGALVLGVGIVSGVIPAMVVSRYQPIDVVKGSFKLRTKMVFSKVFLVFQNVITVALIASSLIMSQQVKHMINAPLGYNYKNIIDIDAWDGLTSYTQISAFKKEALQLACVKNVGLASATPLGGGNNLTMPLGNDKMISFQILYGDPTYFSMMGFEMLKDNQLAGRGMSVNEEALRQMDLTTDAQEFRTGKNLENITPIASVYKDFQVRSVVGEKYPVMMKEIPDYDKVADHPGAISDYGPFSILVEVEGDHKEAFEQLAALHDRISNGDIFSGAFIEDQIEENFAKEANLLSIIRIFTLIAILISALGQLAMSSFFIRQRSLEIAVRKVFGSTDSQILHKLILTSTYSVLVAFVISIPIVCFAMSGWLKSYIYKISISPLVFVVAGLFALVIAVATVFWLSLKASRSNPAEVVRS